MLAALKWLEDYVPECTLNAQAYARAHFPKEDPHWTPIMAEITSNLDDIRRHYWRHDGRRERP
jgi:hypothetical protein